MTNGIRTIVLSPYQMALRRLIALTDGFKNYERSPQRIAFDRWLHPEPVKRSCDTAIARFVRSPLPGSHDPRYLTAIRAV